MYATDYGERIGLALEGSEGILLARQYRHLIDRISWEIPGGGVNVGESLELAALRQCLEETGGCRGLKPLLMFQPGLDTLHNPTHLFHTCNFERKGEINEGHGSAVYGRNWDSLDQCLSMIWSSVIVDSLSMIALLSYYTFLKQKSHHAV